MKLLTRSWLMVDDKGLPAHKNSHKGPCQVLMTCLKRIVQLRSIVIGTHRKPVHINESGRRTSRLLAGT